MREGREGRKEEGGKKNRERKREREIIRVPTHTSIFLGI